MAQVTGMTAEAIQEIVNQMVVNVTVNGSGQVVIHRKDGSSTPTSPVISPTVALQKAWPVGSIFTSISSTNPDSLIGIGTWVRYAEGKMLVSQDSGQTEFDAVGETGGSKTTTLVVGNLPAHTHTIPAHSHDFTLTYNESEMKAGDGTSRSRVTSINIGSTSGDVDRSADTASAPAGTTGSGPGSSLPINNMPPYVVVYMWRRTA